MGSKSFRDKFRREFWAFCALVGLLCIHTGIVLTVFALKKVASHPVLLKAFGIFLIVMGVVNTVASWYFHRQWRERRPLFPCCARSCPCCGDCESGLLELVDEGDGGGGFLRAGGGGSFRSSVAADGGSGSSGGNGGNDAVVGGGGDGCDCGNGGGGGATVTFAADGGSESRAGRSNGRRKDKRRERNTGPDTTTNYTTMTQTTAAGFPTKEFRMYSDFLKRDSHMTTQESIAIRDSQSDLSKVQNKMYLHHQPNQIHPEEQMRRHKNISTITS